MTIQEVRELLHKSPFQPFVIHLADGSHFHVEHPDFVALSPVGRTFIVYDLDGHHHVIDAYLVTRLEVRNGKAKGKKGKGHNGA